MFPYSFKYSSISSRSGARIFFGHNRADHSCDALRLRYDQWRGSQAGKVTQLSSLVSEGKKLEKLGVGRAADPIGDDVCLSVRPSILLSTYLSILEMT